MKGLVSLKRAHLVGDASSSSGSPSWLGYLSLSLAVICLRREMETVTLMWPFAAVMTQVDYLDLEPFHPIRANYTFSIDTVWLSCHAFILICENPDRKTDAVLMKNKKKKKLLAFFSFDTGFHALWYLSVIVWWKSCEVTKATVESRFILAVISACKTSSSDLIIRFLVFMLTATEDWRQINS